MWHSVAGNRYSIMNMNLQKINKIIYITAVACGKIISDKTNTRPARKSKENFTMKTEINFRNNSHLIPCLRRNSEKLLPLADYPTSRNARVWASYNDEYSTAFTLVSYETFPARYYDFAYRGEAELDIEITPRDLTATTRKHIYAFVRQFVPTKRAKAIINTLRFVFTQPAANKDEYTGEPIYKMCFDICPE